MSLLRGKINIETDTLNENMSPRKIHIAATSGVYILNRIMNNPYVCMYTKTKTKISYSESVQFGNILVFTK